jgi:2-haloacid dehalogenase
MGENMAKRMTPALQQVKALAFDVFGTVVDWRGSITREGHKLGRELGIRADWSAFADAWRAGYRPAMDDVRTGRLPWTNIDGLHRRILDRILDESGLDMLSAAQKDRLNRAWHRLDPWPDAVRGLKRLKKGYLISTLSNGNVSLLTNMAKRARLPWDCVLSAELFRHYKPDPEAYRGAAAMLGFQPHEVMMVAAHKDDLRAAQAAGLRAAFVQRPLEYGDAAKKDVKPEMDFDVNARDFIDLAAKLGV